MSVLLQLGRDVQGYPTKATPVSENIYSGILEQGDALSITVPSSSQVWLVEVVVQPAASVWFANNATAVAPSTAGELASASAELICCYESFQRMVKADDVLSFVTTDTTATLSVVLYSL